MTQAEMNAKAMSDIFAIEDATPVFESIGNSLDLGLDPVEDDTPKSFDDLLEVGNTEVYCRPVCQGCHGTFWRRCRSGRA